MSLKSSLRSEVVNSLPNVYHRPQEGSGCKTEFKYRERKNYDSAERERISFDNPNVNSLKAFDGHGIDSLHYVRKFVGNYNHPDRHSAKAITIAKAAYLGMFADLNLCWRCKQPLKVRHARVSVRPGRSHKLTTLLLFAYNVDFATTALLGSKAIQRRVARLTGSPDEVLTDKSQKRPHQYMGYHYHPSKDAGEAIHYADIPSHYEVFQQSDGKLFYRYVDGTNRDIRVRYRELTIRVKRKRFGKLRNETKVRKIPYFAELYHEDGKLLEREVFPKPTYRVLNRKCGCLAK